MTHPIPTKNAPIASSVMIDHSLPSAGARFIRACGVMAPRYSKRGRPAHGPAASVAAIHDASRDRGICAVGNRADPDRFAT
jgi:hypothetical protein